jgi:hypothetical protein
MTAGAGDTDDGVHELALYERPALDLEAQPDKERRHRVEVRDGDADMVKTSNVRHEVRLRDLLVSWAAPVEARQLVSGAGRRFSTWNHAFSSSIVPHGEPSTRRRLAAAAPSTAAIDVSRPAR